MYVPSIAVLFVTTPASTNPASSFHQKALPGPAIKAVADGR
jgi:hypothetical protein